MTSPGEANVVPVALVLDGRIGHTVWAAPWLEDGEEWQAFLGAGSRVFVFENLDDLAAFLASGAENDLSDHPAWTMLRTLPAEQLNPEPDYRFDLDEVPELTRGEPDDEVVMRVGDTIDMVQRIAECCDDGPLLNLLDSPAFAALLDEETEFEFAEAEDDEDGVGGADEEPEDDELVDTDDIDGADRNEDDPWAEIGEAVRTAWPLVTRRVNECLRWFAPGEQPERVTPVLEADADRETAATDDETGGDPVAGPAQTASGDIDEKAARFWAETGIAPVRVVTPSGSGYTLRCYLDDEARFLGSEQRIAVFRTVAGLREFVRTDHDHDLAELDSWPQVRGAESLPVTPSPDDSVDLGAAEAQVHAGPDATEPVLLNRASEFLLDAAEYCDLVGVTEALADDGPLGHAIAAVSRPAAGGTGAGTAGNADRGRWDGEHAAALWRDAVGEVESALHWHD